MAKAPGTNQLTGNIFVTGGAGFLGRGILRRARDEQWPARITVYSRDEVKHARTKQQFPDARFVRGDVGGDLERLVAAMAGHDMVIHAAATKVIPTAEFNVCQTIQDNVIGSIQVALAACLAGVKRVVAISTDKVCHSVNTYGMTKALMERVFQEAQRWDCGTDFRLVRYGNVLDSTASVLNLWREQIQDEGVMRVTDPDMTRFWLTVDQAVDLILLSLDHDPATVTIPMLPALRMGDMAAYVYPDAECEVIGLRPGEKRHEELLTREERPYTLVRNGHFVLHPSTGPFVDPGAADYVDGYSSADPVRWLGEVEFLQMAEVE